MNAPFQKPGRLTADRFVEWAMAQGGGRFELFDGEVTAMAPERAAHNALKLNIAIGLADAVRTAHLSGQVFTDGMAVRIDETTVFEPDAMVRCGEPLDPDATVVVDPVIVVEVLSPSTEGNDSNLKLDRYFRLPTLQHYLIFRTTSPTVIHHVRTSAGIAVRIVQPGPLRLDPPGITLQLGTA